MIAGYSGENGTGDILWSWHVWVTDYAPSSIGSETVLEENRRKLVYKQGSNTRLPMMDRNLGAVAGYDTVPNKELERSKANGLMYQWGRKDPYRSSYTNSVIPDIPVSETIESPMDGLLSCYRGDGITFAMISFDYSTRVSYQTAYQNRKLCINRVSQTYGRQTVTVLISIHGVWEAIKELTIPVHPVGGSVPRKTFILYTLLGVVGA